MDFTRRDFVKASGLSTLALASYRLYGASDARETLPSPDFTYVEGETRFIAGLRPFRRESYRLEMERLGEKTLVHNYGHGGGGITMSWGSAHEVRDLVLSRTANTKKPKIAVLGAGAIGMTSAMLLVEAGFHVTIYAKGFLEETTSHVAGGQWAPSTVAYREDEQGQTEFHRILRRSFRTHESKIGKGFGVSRIRNYTEGRAKSFEIVPRDVIPEAQFHDPSPLEYHKPGFSYETLLVEPPIFLRRLEVELREAGVWLRRKEFSDVVDVLSLNESVVINCMGLGAGHVFADDKMVPIRGQLVLLKPQLNLNYLYSGIGYMFPRRDCVVVGGSFEEGIDIARPDPEMCFKILAKAKEQFQPHASKTKIPDWMYREELL